MIHLDCEWLLITLATAAAARAALSLALSLCRGCVVNGLGAGGLSPALRCRVPVGDVEPLLPRGEGAGGFISIAPRTGGATTVARGAVIGFVFVLTRDLEGGDGDLDLDWES